MLRIENSLHESVKKKPIGRSISHVIIPFGFDFHASIVARP